MVRTGQWFIIIGLVLSLVLAGCATPQAPAPERPAAASPTPAAPQLTREQQLVEAAKKEGGEVTLWVHTIAEQINLTKLFQARYPFLKMNIWNSQGAEILAKLAEESKAGRHSVDVLILSSEMADARTMGLLSEYEFPNVVGWTNQPKHNFSRGLGGAGRVIVYNTNVVAPAEVPKTYEDLTSTKWAGKTFMSTSGEDTPLFWAYLWREGDKLNWDKAFSFWGDVAKNSKPLVASGFSGPLARLAAGEKALFLPVSTPSTMRLMSLGAPIAIAPLGSVSGDMASIGLAKDAPHPNSARLLIDWLTSSEGVLAYANPTQYFVVDPKLTSKSVTNSRFKALNIEWDALPPEAMNSENLKKSSDFWMKALGR
ncbi:MAG: iron transporter substrate-binding protein [Dehalococcoidia bacterium]|nr:iron transporter substrate-binding protein [Dehalococcoidia bacterium]